MKVGSRCSHCEEGRLEYCPADEPWSDEHLICPECYSTFNMDTDDD